MKKVYIVTAVRTPIGRFGGDLASISPVDLGSHVMQAALKQAEVSGKALDMYIFGNVLGTGHGQLLPRQAALKAGIPLTVNGYGINMVCSSSMMAVINAATAIKADEADLVLAGGVESMSQTGFFLSHRARWGYKLLLGSPETVKDILVIDGITDPITSEVMGEQAERLATEYKVTRAELDEIALYSHERAVKSTAESVFQREITPIDISGEKGFTLIDQDEGIRHDINRKSLGKLKSAFKTEGMFTVGNSSQISDGAAALLLASQKAVDDYGLNPIAEVLGANSAAGETWRFLEMPVFAVKGLLENLNLKTKDIDLFENNEAFALSNILFSRMLGISYSKLNPYGGAIAIGHPIGASGARILVTLLNALQQEDKNLGIASICHGTGGATALAVKRF